MATNTELSESELPIESDIFADRLIEEIDLFIDEHELDESRFDEKMSEVQMREGLYTRVYNEIMAVDLPRRQLEGCDDSQVFIHLLKQIEDEAKHARMLSQRIWQLDGNPEEVFERADESVMDYWAEYDGKDPIEIGAMMQCGSERMASFRVAKEIDYYDDETATIYEDVIDPEEQFHAKIGVAMLRRLCTDRKSQVQALQGSRNIREIILDRYESGVREAYTE
jgi:bacterioferritin (cytochrome b1)